MGNLHSVVSVFFYDHPINSNISSLQLIFHHRKPRSKIVQKLCFLFVISIWTFEVSSRWPVWMMSSHCYFTLTFQFSLLLLFLCSLIYHRRTRSLLSRTLLLYIMLAILRDFSHPRQLSLLSETYALSSRSFFFLYCPFTSLLEIQNSLGFTFPGLRQPSCAISPSLHDYCMVQTITVTTTTK